MTEETAEELANKILLELQVLSDLEFEGGAMQRLLNETIAAITTLRSQLAQAREALEFYAFPNTHTEDWGERARTTLRSLQADKGE
jgi:hypothetical protein